MILLIMEYLIHSPGCGESEHLFSFCGVIPLTWFIVSRANALKTKATDIKQMDEAIHEEVDEKLMEEAVM